MIAALAFLGRELPGERVGAIGVSLGAAGLALAHPRPAPHAVVLESMYPTIAEAVVNRLTMRLGPLGRPLAPLLLWRPPLRLGIGQDQLRPVEAVARLGAPVPVASGREDLHTPWPETERIIAAALQPKAHWAVDGAAMWICTHSTRRPTRPACSDSFPCICTRAPRAEREI